MSPLNGNGHEQSQEAFARRLIARLSHAEDEFPYDVSERLRAARTRAVMHRKREFVPLRLAREWTAGEKTLTLQGPAGKWAKLAGWLPMVGLVVGLVVIQMVQNDQRASELAEIDAALLTDDLPPAAYTDPGFAHFLKTLPSQSP